LGNPPDHGSGSGSALNPIILITAGISALVATVIATFSIWLQLKNYRRPILQRYVFSTVTYSRRRGRSSLRQGRVGIVDIVFDTMLDKEY
jgi:hypothetical protein